MLERMSIIRILVAFSKEIPCSSNIVKERPDNSMINHHDGLAYFRKVDRKDRQCLTLGLHNGKR